MSIIYSPTFSSDIIITSDYPMPIIPSIVSNISYTRPLSAAYSDLNQDPQIRNQLTKYFYYKVLDKFLYEDLFDLLSYLTVSNDKVNLAKNPDKASSANDSQEIVEKKVAFIERALFSKDDMYKILKRLTAENGVEWIQLPHNQEVVVAAVRKYLKQKLRDGDVEEK